MQNVQRTHKHSHTHDDVESKKYAKSVALTC